jgi:hypothetical protein
MLLLAALCITVAIQSVPPQKELPREVIQLAQIRRNVQRFAATLPDFTCLETIERHVRRAGKKTFERLDTLRLEVGMIGNKEVFSWPGADSFEDREPGEIVAAGTVSTGEYSQLLRAVFLGGASVVTFHGEEELNGRKALRYDYSIPLFGFRWRANLAGVQGDVAAKGSFWADAESLELLRLDAIATDIPPGLPLVEMVSRIDYGRVRIHGKDYWLPQSSTTTLKELSGLESLNRIAFSHCRQYTGESALTFDTAGSPAAAPPRKLETIQVPAGLTLSLRLETAINSKTASVGDLISARLDRDAALNNAVVIPKGATVSGRIRRLERLSGETAAFAVGLEFSEIEFENRRARFYGRLENVESIRGLSSVLSTTKSESREFPSSTMQGFTVHTARTEKQYAQDLPGVGTFFMSGAEFTLPAGMKMTWKSAALPGRPAAR